MVRTRVSPARHGLRGEVEVPGDKSMAHRAVLLAAIARGPSSISHFCVSEDTLRTVGAVMALGVSLQQRGERLTVHGKGWQGLRAPVSTIDCGNSGTTMRLLAGLLAGRPFLTRLDGDASLRLRPMQRIIEPLSRMGAEVTSQGGNGRAPLIMGGGSLRAITYESPVASAQVKSAVLLAGLQAQGRTRVEEPHKSRDHTERMIVHFGGKISVEENVVAVDGMQELEGREVTLPGDLSSAAFLLVAALLIPGSELWVRRVGVNPTRMGVIEILRAMGAEVRIVNLREEGGEPVGDVGVNSSTLTGVTVEGERVVRAIDECPILTVAAAMARGTTVIRDAEELRVKESDRLGAMAAELRKLGGVVEEFADGLAIQGGGCLRGGTVKSYGDHRVAMALAVAGLVGQEGVEIQDAECVSVSFPGFFALLEKLAG